jgi:hypothetical protein
MCIFLVPSFIPAGPVLHLGCDKWPTSFSPPFTPLFVCISFSFFFFLFSPGLCTFSHRDAIVPFVAHPPTETIVIPFM